MTADEKAAAAAARLRDEAAITADQLLATAANAATALQDNTQALTAIQEALVDQNAYLHRRVHDLAGMIVVLQGAVGLLWTEFGLDVKIGPLELRELSLIEEPPVGE